MYCIVLIFYITLHRDSETSLPKMSSDSSIDAKTRLILVKNIQTQN